MQNYKHIIIKIVISKFFNLLILLKKLWYAIKKADIIFFLILPLNKAFISKIVNILHCFIENLGLVGIIKDKIIPIKRDYLTIRNVTYIIYQKQNKSNNYFRFSGLNLLQGFFIFR